MPPKKPAPPQAPRVSERPFYPAKPPSSGINSTLNKFPEHIADPDTVRWKAELERKKAAMNVPPWKYEPWGKTAPTRSILFHHPGAHLASQPGCTLPPHACALRSALTFRRAMLHFFAASRCEHVALDISRLARPLRSQ